MPRACHARTDSTSVDTGQVLRPYRHRRGAVSRACWDLMRADRGDSSCQPYLPGVGYEYEKARPRPFACTGRRGVLSDSQHCCSVGHMAFLCWRANRAGSHESGKMHFLRVIVVVSSDLISIGADFGVCARAVRNNALRCFERPERARREAS